MFRFASISREKKLIETTVQFPRQKGIETMVSFP